jgi:hypothetical protein
MTDEIMYWQVKNDKWYYKLLVFAKKYFGKNKISAIVPLYVLTYEIIGVKLWRAVG